MHEACFYEKVSHNRVLCKLCPQSCIISPGHRGICGARENQNGILYSVVYGKPCTITLSSPENAPLYHFLPGHRRLCLATAGCNLRCRFCQNWHISQKEVEEVAFTELSPEEVVEQAKRSKAASISFTYTEPVVSYEYMYDVLKLAQKKGLRTSVVSNGCINTLPLQQLLEVIDAIKIDLKGFTEQFYRETSSGELHWVKQSLKTVMAKEVWLEIVYLVIPTKNDGELDMKIMCEWIAENLGRQVPIHFTRFYPAYEMTNIGPTPVRTLEIAYTTAQKQGLEYVYIGNVPGHMANSTYCHDCGKRIVHRNHFTVLSDDIVNGSCAFCGEKIPGYW